MLDLLKPTFSNLPKDFTMVRLVHMLSLSRSCYVCLKGKAKGKGKAKAKGKAKCKAKGKGKG